MTNPIRPTDAEARSLATALLCGARHGALGVVDPDTGSPMVTRVACAWLDRALHLLVSDLAAHTTALTADPRCSVLLSGPATKGDPLNQPRLTVQCTAGPAIKTDLRDRWLALHPKAKLYIDFADFRMIRLAPVTAHLNGGFGKAYQLSQTDLSTE